jgi:ribonuclease HI
MKAILHSDGGARPTNPGPAGIGVLINYDDHKYELARYLGIKTNNIAEYIAFIVGVKFAAQLGATSLRAYTDSKLIKYQVEGEWRCQQDELKPLRAEAQEQLEKLFGDKWKISWVPRKKNRTADALCTAAILNYKRNPFVPAEREEARLNHALYDPFARV